MSVHKVRVGDTEIKLEARNVPSFFTDGPIGDAWAGGTHRIMLGEFILDNEEGADKPIVRPVANLIMTRETLKSFIIYLQDLSKRRDD